MKKLLTFLMFFLLAAVAAQAEEVYYSLTPVQSSKNTAYATNYDVTVSGITWSVPGNQNFDNYWRIGGKSLDNVQRTIRSKSPINSDISKIVISHNGVSNSNLKVISVDVNVYSNDNYTQVIETSSFKPDEGIIGTSDIVFTPSSSDNWPSGSYYDIIFTLTNPKTSNYGVDLTGVTFYKESGTTPDQPTVAAPVFDVAAGTYTEDKNVKVSNYDSKLSYYYTIGGSNPTTTSTAYNHTSGVAITSSCTLKMIAVDGDNTSSITSAAYVINKPQVFASLEELVAADLTSGTLVTVSFENIAIKDIFVTQQGYRNGVFFDIQKGGKDIEIYYQDVPEEWVVGGTLSGTITCPWTYYERGTTWELAPTQGTWSWENLTYVAPVQKTITALEVSGTPTKTTYNVGDAFETAGLVVTATYSDETTAPITTGFEWEIDYGTGNEAFVAGATSVGVMVYTEDGVMSEVYTVNGLTVNVPVTLTSIAVSGTPTKTAYYAGDTFETAGLVVTGTYSDSHQEVITEGIEWTVDPETLTLETTSVDVMAGVGAVVSEVYTIEGLTVTENPNKTATISSFSATSGDINSDISYEAFKGSSTSAPYINGGNLRLYQGGGYVTITGAKGVKISSVKITTSATYATTTVGYCVDDEDAPTTGVEVAKSSSYTISDLNNNSVSIYCLATDSKQRLEIAAIEVTYTTEDIALTGIALSGEYKTEFIQNETFNHEGVVVTATYSDEDTQDVTSKAEFSEPDMTTTGTKTVTVSYTEGEVTKTATYDITVVAEELTSIALSGDYKTTFKQNETFNHEGLVVTATYNSGRTEDVTADAIVSAPVWVAGNLDVEVSYTANNVTKTASYSIKVIPVNVIFYESFDTNNGTGGNDDQWKGSIATSKIASDNEGWTFANEGGAYKCVKLGTGSKLGAATTPAIGYEGNAALTFKAAAWDGGDSESTTLKLSVVGGGSISPTTVTLKKGEWTIYTVTLTNLTTDSKVKFEGNTASNSRFFLDEVYVKLPDEMYIVESQSTQGNAVQGRAIISGKVTLEKTNEPGVYTSTEPYVVASETPVEFTIGEAFGDEGEISLTTLAPGTDYTFDGDNRATCKLVYGEKGSMFAVAGEYNVTVDLNTMTLKLELVTGETASATETISVEIIKKDGSTVAPVSMKLNVNGVYATETATTLVAGDQISFKREVTVNGTTTTTYLNPGSYKDTPNITVGYSRICSEEKTPVYFNFNNGAIDADDKQPGHGADFNINFYVYKVNDVWHVGVSENSYNDIVTAVNDINVADKGVKAYKVIENGQVVIVRGDQRFNIMGQPIR